MEASTRAENKISRIWLAKMKEESDEILSTDKDFKSLDITSI